MNNRTFAKKDTGFKKACGMAADNIFKANTHMAADFFRKIQTPRQASKFRRGKGIVYKAINNLLTQQ